MLRLALAASLVTVVACAGDDTCDDPGVAPTRVINPATLACVDNPDADFCTWSPSDLTWGRCDSPCAALTETSCLITAGCRTAYDFDCFFGGVCPGAAYLGCFPVDGNPDFVTGCAGLDAWSCSRHEQCAGTYRRSPSCDDGVDSDGDGAIDEADECGRAYARCIDEPVVGG